MLTLNQIACKIDDRYLFSNLSLTLLPSSIIYLKGSNGCGKTSLLRIIAGIQEPSNGHILKSKEMSPCLYIGHNLGIKPELTVMQHIQMWASVYNSKETIGAVIHYMGIEHILEKRCYQLSAGNQKKVALTKLMICKSDLWLLDEIDVNLDSKNKEFLNGLIVTKANNSGIVILTSHADQIPIKSANVLNLEELGQ